MKKCFRFVFRLLKKCESWKRKVEESKIINKNQLSPILISINNIKEKMIDNANRNMPKRTANLLLGILIGERDNIQEDIIESFRTANLSHILAVSGAHTSYIILGITYLISKQHQRKRRFQSGCRNSDTVHRKHSRSESGQNSKKCRQQKWQYRN